MNKSSMLINRSLMCIILSLSVTAIYAEVSGKGQTPGRAINPESLAEQLPAKIGSGWQLQAEQWELARSGETILSLPVLNQLISAWLSDKQKSIEIQYPGGEDGEFWVQELTDWLVSLGIPSKHMVMTPGSGADDVIKFNIINK